MIGRLVPPADRRDRYLLKKAGLFTMIGAAYTWLGIPRTVRLGVDPITRHIPLSALGALWLVAAALLAIGACSAGRHRAGAFGIAYFVPAIFAVIYLLAWLTQATPYGWFYAGLLGWVAAATYDAAGLVDPARGRQ